MFFGLLFALSWSPGLAWQSEAKGKAKREGRPVAAGEFNDACACSAACSSGAMRFGDINEKESPISKLVEDERAYYLLEHVGTKPNVVYQVKVRNNNEV